MSGAFTARTTALRRLPVSVSTGGGGGGGGGVVEGPPSGDNPGDGWDSVGPLGCRGDNAADEASDGGGPFSSSGEPRGDGGGACDAEGGTLLVPLEEEEAEPAWERSGLGT